MQAEVSQEGMGCSIKGKGKLRPRLYPIRALSSFLGWGYRASLPDNTPTHLTAPDNIYAYLDCT